MAKSKSTNRIIAVEERLTANEAHALKVRLAEIGARNQHFSVTFDGGWLVHADFGSGRNLVRVVLSGGAPRGPQTAQIIGHSEAAVARFIARLWPTTLTVEDFKEPRRRGIGDSWFPTN